MGILKKLLGNDNSRPSRGKKWICIPCEIENCTACLGCEHKCTVPRAPSLRRVG